MASRKLKFWGWGWDDQRVVGTERHQVLANYGERFGITDFPDLAAPEVGDFAMPEPRVQPPASLAGICSADPHDRLAHALGKSLPDTIRMFDRNVPHIPDLVAFPEHEHDVAGLLDWAGGANIAVIPFGGGSSVVGGVEAAVGAGYAGVLTLSLVGLNRVLEVDQTSRAARIQSGMRGPDLEAALKPHGLTLRHFPQSFEMATLGGWIATRSGGHFATLYTHIDEFVESLRSVTPAGILESRRLPGSGAGPSPDRFMIGSEGTLGIITEAWMRLQSRPKFRASRSVLFEDFGQAAEAVRVLAQSGLNPSNCRLLNNDEAKATHVNDGRHHVLVLGFESASVPVTADMQHACELVQDLGGRIEEEAPAADSHKAGAVGAWRSAFIRMPFYREVITPYGIIFDTFETATTWDRFPTFHDGIMTAANQAIREATGRPGLVTCRFTHVYPDGPAPYYSFHAYGERSRMLEQWQYIKDAAGDAIERMAGTITHHHAVGRDHMPWYRRQRPALFGAALRAAKTALDPHNILNPGVLV